MLLLLLQQLSSDSLLADSDSWFIKRIMPQDTLKFPEEEELLHVFPGP